MNRIRHLGIYPKGASNGWATIVQTSPIEVSCLHAFFLGGSYFLAVNSLPIYFQSVENANPLISGMYKFL